MQYPEALETLLKAQRAAGVDLSSVPIRAVIIGVCDERAPGLLQDLKLSRSTVQRFARTQLNWSYR